jgi:NADH-quinone oxidoreductase subunit J
MSPQQFFFIVTAVVILVSSLMTIITRKMMHSALWFVLALLGVAVIFALLEASFFAVVQVLVYVGAIAILIIFSVMLTRKAMEDTGSQVNKTWVLSLVIVILTAIGGFLAFRSWRVLTTFPTALMVEHYDIGKLGLALVDPEKFALPFEVSSILLLAALVGAIYIALERKEDKR